MEFGAALPQRLSGFFDFGGLVARRGVFRAVPIERGDLNEEQPLDDAMDFGFRKLHDKFGMPWRASTRAWPRAFC